MKVVAETGLGRGTLEFNNKIFCFGDSRTGTTTLHGFLQTLNIKSVHYFCDEANVGDPYYIGRARNWENLRKFIDSGGYQSFTDYPTRLFFREIIHHYPESYFILTYRESVEKWQSSMRRYFSLSEERIQYLTAFYTAWNEEVRFIAHDSNIKYLEINIDRDALLNAEKIASFLGLRCPGPLPHLNKSRTPNVNSDGIHV